MNLSPVPHERPFYQLFDQHIHATVAAVRWGTARTIVVAWVLTIPATALLAAAGALVARAV